MTQQEHSALESVFNGTDTARLVLQYVDFRYLKNVRLVCHCMRAAVDRSVGTLKLSFGAVTNNTTAHTELLSKLDTWKSVKKLVVRNGTEFDVVDVLDGAEVRWPRLSVVVLEGCRIITDTVDQLGDEDSEVGRSIYERTNKAPLPAATAAVAAALSIERLKTLKFMFTQLPEGFIESIIRHRGSSIRTLTVMGSGLHAVPDIDVPGLESLEFTENIETGDEEELLQKPIIPYGCITRNLVSLDISYNILCPQNAWVLFSQTHFENLKSLKVRGCWLDETHLYHFMDSWWPALEFLDLSENCMNTVDAYQYLALAHLPKLHVLHASRPTRCHADALDGLVYSRWPCLEYLYLEEMEVSGKGMRGLLLADMPKLCFLSLHNSILSAGALELMPTGRWTALRELDIGGDEHGVEVRRTVPALSRRKWLTLESLVLRHSGLTSQRAKSNDRKAYIELQKSMPRCKIIIEPLHRM